MSDSDPKFQLTYIPDIDREIFLNTEDDDILFSLCGANKYTNSMCNSVFWYDKFMREFQADLGSSAVINYKGLYKYLSGLNVLEIAKYGAENGYPALIQYAIDNGLKLNEKNNYNKIGHKLARIAASNGNINVLRYLKDNRVDITEGYIIADAAEHRHYKTVKYLVRNGAKLNAMVELPLREAARGGSVRIIKYLLDEAENQEIPYNQESLDISLITASAGNQLEAVKYLVSLGADISARKYRALGVADEQGYQDITDYLNSEIKRSRR